MTQLPDTDLALLIDRLMRSIHFGLQQRAPSFDREGVGPGGGIVLMTLADTGRTGLNELTKRVARDKSQMTRTIRSLEAKGLVERQTSSEDARVTLVCLTPKGERVVQDLLGAVSDVIAEMLTPITPAETQTLKSLLTRIVP